MRWLRRRDTLLLRTNHLGATSTYSVGNTVKYDGQTWVITRHQVINTTPWATIRVYARRAR